MAATTFDIAVKFELIHCVVCGVAMVLPGELLDDKRRLGGHIHCPKGHKTVWKVTAKEWEGIDKLREENKRLKAEIVQIIHLADQAAAAHQAGKSVETHIEELQSEIPATTTPEGWHKCPKCEKTYKNLDRHLLRHLRTSHGMKPEEAFELYKSMEAKPAGK